MSRSPFVSFPIADGNKSKSITNLHPKSAPTNCIDILISGDLVMGE
jgi:hypothetical protein